jgi:DNA invertase Pin-like site-specific DNA recombinase
MASGKFVAYYRVSTAKQGASGLGLGAQQEAVRAHLNGGRWQLVGEFTEIESGRKNDRAQLAAALAECRMRGATLLVAKLDRLARNVAFISALMEAGVEFVAVDFPQANRLTVHILAAVAEHEAAMIRARTKAALQQAKARGVALGGARDNSREIHKAGVPASIAARKAKAAERAKDVLPIMRQLRDAGRSLTEVANELNARSYATPRGKAWTASQIRQTMLRNASAAA